jgi:hypothetical protein
VLFVLYKWTIFNLDEIGQYFDTTSYASVANVPILDKRFWLRERPFTLPLLYKFLGAQGEIYLIPTEIFQKITQFQLSFSILSWIVLGASISYVIRNKWARVAAYTIILFFGGAIDLSQWDRILISESISLSLFAMFVAMLVLGFHIWDRLWVMKTRNLGLFIVLFLSISTLYIFTRDVNAYLLLIVITFIAVSALIRSRNLKSLQKPLIIVVLLLLIFFAQALSSSVGHRWYGPFRNVFFARILPSDQALMHFLDAGLPLDRQDVSELRGYEREQFMELFNSSTYVAANDWILENGRSVYVTYLLKYPIDSFMAPLKEIRHLVSPDSSEYRIQEKETPEWVVTISKLSYPSSSLAVALMSLIPGILLFCIFSRQEFQAWWLVPYLLLLSAYPLMFIIYHGDAIELERHALQVSMQIRLASWLLIVALLDVATLRRRFPKGL